jgi:chromosome segregation ATPase
MENLRQTLEVHWLETKSYGENLLAEKLRITEESNALNSKQVGLNESIHEQSNTVANLKMDLQRCKESIAHQTEILHRYEISEEYVFESSVNANTIQERIANLREELSNSQQKVTHLRECLENFNKNRMHVSKEFAEILEDNGVNFQTGEDYLSNQSETFRNYVSKDV